jgi:hypothetical protein
MRWARTCASHRLVSPAHIYHWGKKLLPVRPYRVMSQMGCARVSSLTFTTMAEADFTVVFCRN